MRKVYIFYLIVVLAIFFSTIATGQIVVFEDNFDAYNSGQQIACQNPTVWTTWSNNPCNATEDAYISSAYSYSGTNSLVILQNNDIVRDHGLLTNGICEINFQLFIPTGKAGYFNTLANFAPPTYVWAMQVFFNSSGTGRLDAAGANAATFSYPQNKWFSVKVVADLVIDQGEFWVDDILIHTWQWSKGTFGSSTIPKQVDGTDFYGNTASDEMYIDNYNIVHFSYVTKTVSTTTGGDWTSTASWVSGTVPTANSPVEIVSSATVTLNNNITRNAATLVKGRLNFGSSIISGSGDFILSSNATLEIGSVSGVSLLGATGNIQVTGARLLNPFANYIYDGSSAQITGSGLPALVNDLTINNASGVTISSDCSVGGSLNILNGNIITNANTISVGSSISNPGTLVYTSGTVIGNCRRWFTTGTASNVLFPIGTSTHYRSVNISFTGAPTSGGTLTAFFNSTDPGIIGLPLNDGGTSVVNAGKDGYWTINTGNGIAGGTYSLDLTADGFIGVFNYATLRILKRSSSGGNWLLQGTHVEGTGSNSIPIVHRVGMSNFSEFGIGGASDNPLPVELSSFTAIVKNGKVNLKWRTETEVNNYGFDILRRAQNDSWERIGFVDGYGNSNSPKEYSFMDENVNGEKYSYRLKQIDNDGTFEYSKIIEVNMNSPIEYELSQNYPNPFNSETTIKYTLSKAGFVNLSYYNILGQLKGTLINEFKEAGIHTVNFNASKLNSGTYFYKFEVDNFVQLKKMSLIK